MKTLTTLLASIFIVSSLFSQSKISTKKVQKSRISVSSQTSTSKTEKDLAKDFSLKIVESYFTNNTDFYYKNLSDKIYKLQDNKLQEKTINKTWIYDNFSKINRENKSFKYYKKSYKFEILSKK